MTACRIRSDRRRDDRLASNLVIRWKRPGRIEDNKAWMVDESRSGLGFITTARVAPRPGDVLNIRRRDGDAWATIDRTIRVARTSPASDGDLIMIGCTME